MSDSNTPDSPTPEPAATPESATAAEPSAEASAEPAWEAPAEQATEAYPDLVPDAATEAYPDLPAAPAPEAAAYAPPPAPPAYDAQPPYGAPPAYGAAPAYGTAPVYGAQPTYSAQPTYGAPAYGAAPAYGGYAAQPKTNTLAIVSLIAAIAGLTFVPFIGSITAVITGHMSLSQIKQRGEGGRGLGLTGTILGWVGIGLILLSIIVLLAFVPFFIANVRTYSS